MSSLMSPARLRAPRAAVAAVERARLSLVPTGRVRAPRAPFAVLVLALLGVGVVGLLLFNTHMQQASFYATSLQKQADDLTAQQQKLAMELDALRDPQHLAEQARGLGMVAPAVPAFIELATGRVLGTPTAGTGEDAVRVSAPPAPRPQPLRPKPIVHTVLAQTASTGASQAATGATTGQTGQSPTATGPASAGGGAAAGRNGQVTTDPGATP